MGRLSRRQVCLSRATLPKRLRPARERKQIMWLKNFFLGRRAPSGTPGNQRVRPAVELLEDRTVPASFTASTVPELIADINAANLAGGPNTITLAPATTFTLTAADNAADGGNGLPVVAAGDELTILGNGDVIERSATLGTPDFRLFDVAAGAALSLEDLTLQGGLTYSGGGA